MGGFEIWAVGEDFDVDEYLAQGGLHFDEVWRRGDPQGCGSTFPTSGLSKHLGDRASLSLPQQEAIAEEFIAEHTTELRKLAEHPGVDALVLGLHYAAEPGTVNVVVGPSFRLMFECLRAGVHPNYYVDLQRGWPAKMELVFPDGSVGCLLEVSEETNRNEEDAP